MEPARQHVPLVWTVDPLTFALEQGEHLRRGQQQAAHAPLCSEVGRRLLLAQFEFSSWVLRRVEKVEFVSDRRVSRSSSIELAVHPDAPVLVGDDGEEHWLVPLSVMRRRTLVKLDLRDEEGRSVSMLGMRFTQKLDEAMLRAAALLADGAGGTGRLPEQLELYIRDVVSGRWAEVRDARKALADMRRTAGLVHYFDDDLFAAALERMWHNFTLYVALPKGLGRHRLLRLAFEERVLWKQQRATLTGDRTSARRQYTPLQEIPHQWTAWRERLGLEPTRIRFLTPSAENCSSYHFEFSAPHGLGLSSLALLAGRPNAPSQPGEHVPEPSWDRVDNPGHTGGLHAVEIPNGSLARAQVSLRISSRGWLSTLVASCWAVTLVLLTVTWHVRVLGRQHQWTSGQVTNIVLLLVTVAAGAATYVAQHHTVDVANRMVVYLRGVGTVAIAIPAVAAMMLVYLRDNEVPSVKVWLGRGLGVLLTVALACAVLVTLAWMRIRKDEAREGPPSPWDMTRLDADSAPLAPDLSTFDSVAELLGFDIHAVGVASAEGWHEAYGWSTGLQATTVDRLSGLGSPDANVTSCRCARVSGHGP